MFIKSVRETPLHTYATALETCRVLVLWTRAILTVGSTSYVARPRQVAVPLAALRSTYIHPRDSAPVIDGLEYGRTADGERSDMVAEG